MADCGDEDESLSSRSGGGSDFCDRRETAEGLYLASSRDPSTPCVLLFSERWALDSALKLSMGCLGLALLGASVQGLLCLTQYVSRRRAVFGNRQGCGRRSVLFLLRWAAAVLTSLAAMAVLTYSVEVLLSLTFGLAAGRSLFDPGPSKQGHLKLPNNVPPPSQEEMTSVQESSKGQGNKSSRRKFSSFHL